MDRTVILLLCGMLFALPSALAQDRAAITAASDAERQREIGLLGISKMQNGFRTLTERRARELGVKYRFNRGLRGLVSSDAGVRAGTLGARVAPAVLRRIIRYAGDESLVP